MWKSARLVDNFTQHYIWCVISAISSSYCSKNMRVSVYRTKRVFALHAVMTKVWNARREIPTSPVLSLSGETKSKKNYFFSAEEKKSKILHFHIKGHPTCWSASHLSSNLAWQRRETETEIQISTKTEAVKYTSRGWISSKAFGNATLAKKMVPHFYQSAQTATVAMLGKLHFFINSFPKLRNMCTCCFL